MARANELVDNSGALEATQAAVDALVSRLEARASAWSFRALLLDMLLPCVCFLLDCMGRCRLASLL